MKVTQEEDLVPRRTILGITLGAIVVVALFVGAAWWLTNCRAAQLGERGPSLGADRASQPAPEEIHNIELIPFGRPAVAERLDAAKNTRLERYGWASQPEGIIHMPIERAMDLYLRQGGLAPALRPPEQPADRPLPDEQRFEEPPASRLEREVLP